MYHQFSEVYSEINTEWSSDSKHWWKVLINRTAYSGHGEEISPLQHCQSAQMSFFKMIQQIWKSDTSILLQKPAGDKSQ